VVPGRSDTDELGPLIPPLGQGNLHFLVPHLVLEHLDAVAHTQEPDEDQGEGDEAKEERPGHRTVHVQVESRIQHGPRLVQRLPPVHRKMHDGHIEGDQQRSHGAAPRPDGRVRRHPAEGQIAQLE